jgi:hypothetical protein
LIYEIKDQHSLAVQNRYNCEFYFIISLKKHFNMTNENNPKPLPWFFIGKEASSQRVTNFQKQKLPLLTESLGKPDTQSIWYSKEHISSLLEEINHLGGDGLRIYFGAYDTSHETFGGQLCLIMAATKELKIGEKISHKDVSIENESDFVERSTLSRDFNISSNDNSAATSKDFNYGSPCPPLCE